MPQGILLKLTELQASPYYAHVKSLKPLVVGRDVARAEAGPSGFTLYLSDGNWVLCALKENEWSWKTGSEDLGAGDKSLMHSCEYGDASGPLREDVPYAQEGCDFRAEVAKAIGRKITEISVGEKCFNFCFEGGRELDVTLRRDPSGKIAYRVFWEQW